jgi:hypothetical protein
MAIDPRNSETKAATLWELGKGQFLFVRCGAWVRGRRCDHSGIVTPARLPRGFDRHTPLHELPKYLACSKCGQRSPETRVSVWR